MFYEWDKLSLWMLTHVLWKEQIPTINKLTVIQIFIQYYFKYFTQKDTFMFNPINVDNKFI